MDSAPVVDNAYVDSVGGRATGTNGLRPSRYSGEDKVEVSVEKPIGNLAEKFVDIGGQSRGCNWEESNAVCVSVSDQEGLSFHEIGDDHLSNDIFHGVDAFDVNMSGGDAGYVEKQQNHVTPEELAQRDCEGIQTGAGDDDTAVSAALGKVPPDIVDVSSVGLAEGATSMFEISCSANSKATDPTVSFSMLPVTRENNLTDTDSAVNMNIENHSISDMPLSTSEVCGLDTASNRLDIALASSTVYDAISADIVDFPLHEMVDTRSVTSLSDLLPDCQDLFNTSTSGDQMLLPSSTEADFISVAPCQSVHSEQNSDTQSSTPVSHDNNSMYANSETDPDENREPLTYELQQGYRILREIMAESHKSINWPFMNAIDSTQEGCEDYYEQVKHPMWLKKMRDKFDHREYKNITEFVADMRLMLENCYRYNGPDHAISKKGQRLETMMEQKLALLSRELREKTSICATSGKPVEETKITGTRRRKVIIPHDSTALLNQLRLEAQEREREARRQLIQERKQAQEAYQQELQSWEEKLFQDGLLEQMKSMWELPQIGHFLFLCAVPLNIGEVMQWELERCFLLPRESSTMQRIMTALLSTPYQRTRLDRKPMMPYKVWEDKLRTRLRLWYKTLQDYNGDIDKASEKLGLEAKFFRVVGLHSPLERKHYHELTYYQKVWIAKGLCDWCLETQDSIREAIEAQPITEQRPYDLGTDADGFSYLHFPQFCGADLRIYKQAPVVVPESDKATPERSMSPKKGSCKPKLTNRKKTPKSKETVSTRPRDSRLRQNPRQIAQFQVACSDTEDDGETSTQRSSAVDTTTDLDSGQESSTQDSGISEESDSNEPPSKTSRGGNGLMDNGTDVSLDLLIDATPSRLTRSLMRNLTKVFSSASTPSASRESSPGHSSQRPRVRRSGPRARKLAKSSRESSPSAHSDMHSVDGSPCSESVNIAAKSRQRKRTRYSRQAAKPSEDKKRAGHELECSDPTDKDECLQMTSKNVSEALGAEDEVIGKVSPKPAFIKSEIKTETENGINSDTEACKAEESNLSLTKANSNETLSGSGIPEDERLSAENMNPVDLCEKDTVSGEKDNEQCDKTAVLLQKDRTQDKCGGIRNAVDSSGGGGGQRDMSMHSPKAAIDRTSAIESQCDLKQSNMNGEVAESQDIGVAGSDSRSHSSQKCVDVVSESRDAEDVYLTKDVTSEASSGSTQSSAGVSARSTPDMSRSPTPMDVVRDEGKVITELAMPKLSPVLPLPDGSPKKAALEDEISLASTISAVDPNYRPDSPQYQHLAPVKSVPSDVAVSSHCDLNRDDGSERHEVSHLGQKCTKPESGDASIKDEPSGGDADRMVDGCRPVMETIKREADINAQKLDSVKNEKPEIKEEEVEDEMCEITLPEFDKFELVVTDLDTLRQLIAKLAKVRESEVSDNKKSKVSKPSSHKRCVTELHNRLEYLLQELEPWEQKLNSLHKKAIVKMKKEQDSYIEEPEKEEIEDVWESEESASENEDSNSSNEEEAEEEAEQGKEDQEDKHEEMEVVGVTTRGGLKRKKKVVSNDSAKKKKSPETMKEHSASPSPNILQKKTTATEQQPTKSPVKPTLTNQSKELTLAVIGNQPVLLPASQLASLNNAIFLGQVSAKSGASGVQPQIALLSSNSLGGNVLLTTQNPALLQGKTANAAASGKGSPLVSVTQSSDQQKVLFRSPTNSQTFVVTPPQTVSSQPSVTSVSKSSASVEATKPAVTCFNYSNISQLPPDVIQKLLKNQERRLQQGIALNKTLASTQNQNTAPVSCTTAFTNLLKTGLLPVATTEARSKPSVLQQNNISSKADGIVLVNRAVVSTVAGGGAGMSAANLPVQPTMAVCTAAASCHPDISKVVQTSSAELNLLPTLNRSMADQVPVQSLAMVQNPSVLDDKLAKEGPHFALLSSPPKPKYASNVTVKTLLENKHAQQKVLPGQTSGEKPSSGQTSGTTTAEEQNQGILALSKSSDGATTIAACPSRVLSAQPVRSVPLIKGYSQLPVAHALQAVQAVQGASGQVQLVLPGRQQLVMQKPGKQVQLLPAASGKVQLMQGPDGQLHLVQAGPGQSVQLIQGAGGLQGVQVMQGSGGIQVLQAQQAPKLQVVQGTQQQQQQQQQQLKVVQMPTGQRVQLIANQPVIGKTAVHPNLQVQTAVIQSASGPKLVQQAASSGTEVPQKPEDQKLLASDSISRSNEASSVSTEPQTIALAGQKPKLVHIGASGQKVIPLTPQVAAQLHIAMAKKQAIDQAVKTVITSVTTSLPTACIKVSSPFELPSRRPHRSVTITTPAMKAPIPAVRKGDEAKLKPVSSVVAGGCHSSPEPVQSCTVPIQQHTTGVSLATARQPIQSTHSIASNVTTVAATAVSMAVKVQQTPSSLPVKTPQQNVGLRLTAQNILTNKGVIQGVVIPAGVALSQVVLQQLKHMSDTQGLSVFQQSKDGTLQQLLFSSKPTSVVQPAVPQQLVGNVRPQSVQLASSVASSHVAQLVPKQVPASPQQRAVNVSTAAVNKPVILSQGHSPAKILLPAARPIQMVLQNQPQVLATVPVRQTQGSLPAVVPTTVQLLKTAKGVVPRIQMQQVLGASSGEAAILQGTPTVSSTPAQPTAVVSIPQVGTNQHSIQLPVVSTHLAAASQISADKTTLALPRKEPLNTEVFEDQAGTAASALGQTTPSADAGVCVIATPNQVNQPSGDSAAQPSGVVSFKQTSAKAQQALTQQQLLQLIQKQQVQTTPNAAAGEGRVSSVSTAQTVTAPASLVPGSTPKQPSKLVVFNVNGKLMTAQGVPVNLTQGLVKVGNQVIGAQAGLRCQPSSAAGGHSDGSSMAQMAANSQQASVQSSVVLPSSSPSSLSSVRLVASTASPSTEHLQQGHGDMASGLQVLANAANLTANTIGQ